MNSHEEAEDFIESPTFAVKTLVTDDESASLAGKQIGLYKIRKRIGAAEWARFILPRALMILKNSRG